MTADPVAAVRPRLGAPVRVSGLAVTYPDGTPAIASIDLAVRAGEVVAVVGPSGCGKSTLLRVVAGLEPPTAGRVDTHGARVGMVLQEPALLAWRTVRRNVELPGEIMGMPAAERRRRATEALALVGLAAAGDRYPKALSGGMRSRAALARAVLLTPEVFLLDEPFAAVDELTRERLQEDLRRLQQVEGCTMLLVTHSVSEAVYLADRVVVLSPGPARVVADVEVPFGADRPAALRYDPAFGAVAGAVAGALRETAA